LCQKIDTERKGFVKMYHVLNSFQRLTPLSDKLDAVTAQNATILLINICTNAIASYKSTIIDAFIALIGGKASSCPSFETFIVKQKAKTETANQATRIVEDQLFVSDILFELSKAFIEEAASLLDENYRPYNSSSAPSKTFTFHKPC
jgi:hypothetical protein